ncbi:extracellular solute-binding protein [Paenibacillus sp. IB182496]|uniref:Extracellular solute-binding protein n=1 Tax=Paenibacillus sabuli TaxID=2772509 RepID=A0A927BR87_9BACL|nr:extracellular solute-binding protein [Paenibacillus sabuli]MBD2844074.1 extracellular solute-binding protein [Paenibacillus sabuli]
MKFKKAWVLSASALAALVLLSACGSGNGNNGGGSADTGSAPADEPKVELSIWHNFSGDDLRAQTMRGLIEQYVAAHPEVKVDVQAIPPDGYKQRLKTVAAANEMPDLFLSNPGSMIAEFYNGDLLQPIGDLLEQYPEWRDGFLPGAFEGHTFDGEIYAAPVNLSPSSIMYYNHSLFEQYDVKVPTTWDELMTAIETFNANGITPISMGNKAAWVAQSTIIGTLADRVTGSEWFLSAVEQDGAAFTDPQFVEALGYFKQLADAEAFQDGANSIDNTQAEQYFIQGNAAMTLGGTWTLTNLAATASEEALEQVGVTVFPAIPGGAGDPNTITASTGQGFAMNKDVTGAQREAALDLIYTISGPEAQQQIAQSNTLVNYQVEVDPAKVTPLFNKTYELVTSVGFTPIYDAYLSSAGTEAVNNGLQELMLGGDPETVAQKIQNAQAEAVGN